MSAYTNFRDEAIANGLIVDKKEYSGCMFRFDLNMGNFTVPADAATIRQLLAVCRKHFPGTSGEPQAILALIAQKSDLADVSSKIVFWYRSYHYLNRIRSEWISLDEWLSSSC